MFKNKGLILFCLVFLFSGCRNSPDLVGTHEDEKSEIGGPQNSKPAENDLSQDLDVTPDKTTTPDLLLKPNEGISSQASLFRIKNIEREGKPIAYTYTDLNFVVSKVDGTEPQSVKIVKIEVWMKIHGHGLGSYEPVIKQDTERLFLISVSDIFFIMPGPWEINLTLEIDGRKDFVEYPIEVVE